ncbi:MAG TPA: PAS domain S-box protein [Pyrinomonadaceae bacterium]|nr:PAS domain S-box protein [Pyrinomonadaceae bacterium]
MKWSTDRSVFGGLALALALLLINSFVSYQASKQGSSVNVMLIIPNVLACAVLVIMIRDMVLRRRSEEALRQEHGWLEVTLLSIGDAVITTDRNGAVTFLNPVAERLTGWKLEEARGQPLEHVFRVVNEISRKPVDNPALLAMKEGVVFGLANHSILIARDGKEILIDDTGAPIKEHNGRVLGGVLIFRDITERRTAERESALLSRIVESSDDAIISKNLDGIIKSWNASAERLFEYSAADVIGQPITVIIPPERIHEEEMILERLRRGERVEHFQTVRVSRSGRRLDTSLTVSPVRDGSGEIIGASKIVRDITARQRAEEALRQHQEWLAVTLSSIGDAVIATDTTGAIVFVNHVAEALTGWEQEEAQGTALEKVFRIVSEQTKLPAANPALRALEEGVIFGLANHTLLIARDGREIPIDDSAAPIRGRDGELRGAVLIFRDITERRRSENERIQLLNSERAARERAEAANRTKDEFVAMISHEIRSPLSAIVGWCHMLRQGNLEKAEIDRAVETIERNTKTQVQLVEDLLDISRVTAGKLNLNVRAVEPIKSIMAALDSIRPAAEAKSIKLDVQIEPAVSLVTGDPDRLQQVFFNLLSNAVKFTPTHGHISVEARRLDSQLSVIVRDSGIGINPDFLPHIFDRFTQADTTSARKHGGLGLGLAIVRHLVELHGGLVRAESEGEGRGATFTVNLPVRATKPESDDAGYPNLAGAVKGFADLSMLEGIKVLIVDDEPVTRDLLAAIVAQYGGEVRVCASAAEGLAALEEWDPAVLVSDVGMPEEDGYALIKKVRQLESEQRNVPAVALTAYARAEDRMRALASGFQMHLPKPVEADELIMVIASLASRRAFTA